MKGFVMAATVPASEFTHNFDDYDEYRRIRVQRQAFTTAELSDQKIKAIAESRMDPRHDHLDALLDPK
jgi:hypothetical protein